MTDHVVLAPYNEAWPRMFVEEAYRLQVALAIHGLRRVEHVGSTSIPGMIAKPVIDIMASVQEIDKLPRRNDRFWRALEYEWGHGEDDEDNWLYFIKRDNSGRRLIHLHIVPESSAFWSDTILFRDKLRTDSGKAGEYANLKICLAEKFHDDRLQYLNGKRDFVIATVRLAREGHSQNHIPADDPGNSASI